MFPGIIFNTRRLSYIKHNYIKEGIMKIKKLSMFLVSLVAISALASNAMASTLAFRPTISPKIGIGYSQYATSQKCAISKTRATLKKNLISRWRAMIRYKLARSRSFSATVSKQVPYNPTRSYSVSYDRKTAILSVRYSPYGSPHGNQNAEFNAKNEAVTIYGPYNSTKTVYYRNGFSETLAQNGTLLHSEQCGVDVYNQKKEQVKDMIGDGIALINDGGTIEEGTKKDFQSALTIITGGQQ